MEVLEDEFPFLTGDFQVPAVNFPGCREHQHLNKIPRNFRHHYGKQTPCSLWTIDGWMLQDYWTCFGHPYFFLVQVAYTLVLGNIFLWMQCVNLKAMMAERPQGLWGCFEFPGWRYEESRFISENTCHCSISLQLVGHIVGWFPHPKLLYWKVYEGWWFTIPYFSYKVFWAQGKNTWELPTLKGVTPSFSSKILTWSQQHSQRSYPIRKHLFQKKGSSHQEFTYCYFWYLVFMHMIFLPTFAGNCSMRLASGRGFITNQLTK